MHYSSRSIIYTSLMKSADFNKCEMNEVFAKFIVRISHHFFFYVSLCFYFKVRLSKGRKEV